jgi:hypothetical protein
LKIFLSSFFTDFTCTLAALLGLPLDKAGSKIAQVFREVLESNRGSLERSKEAFLWN